MKLDLFYYKLPQKFIAQEPLFQRDRSKLMILDKSTGQIDNDIFFNLAKYINSGDILVLNESKVTKCRFLGFKEGTGAKIECFVLKEIREKGKANRYLALIKPSKKILIPTRVNIGNYFFIVKEKLGYGKAVVEFNESLAKISDEVGKVPLPPYIKNENIEESRYQTIYARVKGSTAAPTAGFHFTEQLIDKLKIVGVKFAKLRLNIGLDTFRPIVEEEIEEHKIHSEHYFLSELEARKINTARAAGGKVIAVGTTTTRVLETIMTKYGILKGDEGDAELYIYPGYKFKIINRIITNFHLPYSTLLVMVSAFAGRENILKAYEEAKINNYRFFSFGDCMLII